MSLRSPFTAAFVVIVLALPFIFSTIGLFSRRRGMVSTPQESYDFLIVGGGTAGAILAARLSQVTSYSILLIEAGSEESWLSSIPLAAPLLQQTNADWSYVTEPQENSCWGFENKTSRWPRGKGLGGTSNINFMVHMRGTRHDYDKWEAMGCHGWSYKDVLPYFIRMETFYGRLHEERNLRGHSGPLPITEAHCSSVCKAWLKAVEDLGLCIGDLNNDLDYGFMGAQLNILNGSRQSVASTYLHNSFNSKNDNLHILLESTVQKLLFSENKVIGLEMKSKDGFVRKISCKKEVIVSAGVVETPKLLILSGIGDSEELHKLKLPQIADLPVGRGLSDHLNFPLYVHIKKPLSLTPSKIKRISTILKYLLFKEGLLSQTGVEVIGTHSSASHSQPDLLFILFNMGSFDADAYIKFTNFKREVFENLFPETNNTSKEGFVVMVSCLHPQSKGRIYLSSSSPEKSPKIDPNYLFHKDDLKCMLSGIELASQLIHSSSLKSLGAELHTPLLSNCLHHEPKWNNSGYVECLVRTAAFTGYHPTGTCRMGSVNDSLAVVNPQLRVKGLRGLRVVDASVMPTQVSGTPHAAIAMIAEKAADILMKSWL